MSGKRDKHQIIPSVKGRPVEFTVNLQSRFLNYITEGKSVASICKLKEMPSIQTVYNHLDSDSNFFEQYKQARARKAHVLVESAIDVPDQCLQEVRSMAEDDKRCNAIVQAHRLKADNNIKIAGLLNKEEYGESRTAHQPLMAVGVKLILGDTGAEPNTTAQVNIQSGDVKRDS